MARQQSGMKGTVEIVALLKIPKIKDEWEEITLRDAASPNML